MKKSFEDKVKKEYLPVFQKLFEETITDISNCVIANHAKEIVFPESHFHQDSFIKKALDKLILNTEQAVEDYSEKIYYEKNLKTSNIDYLALRFFIFSHFIFVDKIYEFTQNSFINQRDKEMISLAVKKILEIDYLNVNDVYSVVIKQMSKLFNIKSIN